MAHLHAVYLTKEELRGLHSMLTSVRDEMHKQPHATFPQYYAGLLAKASLNGLVRRIDVRLTQIELKEKA